MWVSRKKFNELKQLIDEQTETVAKMQDTPVLIGIERTGRENKFTFLRGDKTVVIETMGLISDNIRQWKEDLLS